MLPRSSLSNNIFVNSAFRSKKHLWPSLILLGAFAGCSHKQPVSASLSSENIVLKAALISPTDVQLTWQDSNRDVAGYVVDFATEPQGEYTTLGFLPSDQRTFTHPNLMPDTTWYYRVRAYYGPASDSVDVTLPATLSDKEYVARFSRPEDYRWATPRTIPEKTTTAKFAIRNGNSATKAAPSDLKATLVPSTVSGFQLNWNDHANDEDGYLVEMKPPDGKNFSVRAVLGRDINAFGYAFQPPERSGSLRVRAFYYGPPSNLVHIATGSGPITQSASQQ